MWALPEIQWISKGIDVASLPSPEVDFSFSFTDSQLRKVIL